MLWIIMPFLFGIQIIQTKNVYNSTDFFGHSKHQ